jgi:hypothetical protein
MKGACWWKRCVGIIGKQDSSDRSVRNVRPQTSQLATPNSCPSRSWSAIHRNAFDAHQPNLSRALPYVAADIACC